MHCCFSPKKSTWLRSNAMALLSIHIVVRWLYNGATFLLCVFTGYDKYMKGVHFPYNPRNRIPSWQKCLCQNSGWLQHPDKFINTMRRVTVTWDQFIILFIEWTVGTHTKQHINEISSRNLLSFITKRLLPTSNEFYLGMYTYAIIMNKISRIDYMLNI